MFKGKTILIGIFSVCCFSILSAQEEKSQKEWIKDFYDISLVQSKAYEDLRILCKEIGHRLSGSKELEQAVIWGDTTFQTLEPNSVVKQEVIVPNWERGRANAYLYSKNGRKKLKVISLGGSTGTGMYKYSGKVAYFNTLKELSDAPAEYVKDKIVFIDKAVDDRYINTFNAYGSCVSVRFSGAIEAAKKGAKAVLIRSITNKRDDIAHTGVMGYEAGVDSIPGLALGWESAEYLKNEFKIDSTLDVYVKSSAKILPSSVSHNVIAEIKGNETPENIITVGAHLDSWDLGEGAHDDGAGVVQTIGVLRLFKQLGYQNKNTIRFVLFTNEENGAQGARKYAEEAVRKNEFHLAALESDRGGFSPRGFSIDVKEEKDLTWIKSFQPILEQYGLHDFTKGYAGVDINPLKNANPSIILLGLSPDSQRYFDHHHAKTDVFEAVNRRELELGTASMASIIYLIDQNYKK
jgi:hypothetical protein